jgi:hypothetical protein
VIGGNKIHEQIIQTIPGAKQGLTLRSRPATRADTPKIKSCQIVIKRSCLPANSAKLQICFY